MKMWRACGWLIVVGGLACLPTGCSHPSDEAQVRAAISQAVTAARAADAGVLAAVLSDDFSGNDGDLDKRTLVNLLRLARLRGQSVKVLTGPVSIERRGRRLVASFVVTLSGGHGWFPQHLGVFRVRSGWRNEDGHWRCYSATWKRVLH